MIVRYRVSSVYSSLGFISALLFFHVIGHWGDVYRHVPRIDMALHFFGGFFLARLCNAIFQQDDEWLMLGSIASALIGGIIWEVYEIYIFHKVVHTFMRWEVSIAGFNDWQNDLVFDALGGIVYAVLRNTKQAT
jgi:hypothetical protein